MIGDKINIGLLALDFDGVLTDNYVMVDERGKEYYRFSKEDSAGLWFLRDTEFFVDLKVLILSSETSAIVSKRAKKLNADVLKGVKNKYISLMSYLERNKLNMSNVIYMGNDLNDLEVMKHVAMPTCPANSHPAILEQAVFVSNRNGGDGAVRDLCDFLIASYKEMTDA